MEGEPDDSMIDHLKLLGVMINLIIGVGVVFYVWHKARTVAAPFLRFLVLQIALMNFLSWLLFLGRYWSLNVPGRWQIALGSALTDIGTILGYVILGGLIYAIIRIVDGILERPSPPLLMKCALGGIAVLVVGYGLKWLIAKNSFWRNVHYEIYDNAGIIYILIEIGMLIFLWRQSRRTADAVKAQVGKSFAFLYLARYPAFGLISLIPQPFRVFVFLFFCNIIPVIWLRFFFRAYEERLERTAAGRSAAGSAEFEAVCRTYDISKRERDILAFILAGKSNRDIERELFISYHTVKNHVYNLFQKLGAKNRFELARLVENRAREHRPGDGTERETAEEGTHRHDQEPD